MFIKSITIEGFHNVQKATYTLDKLNYIHGPNGAGKTTVLNAIQLALFGFIPGSAKNTKEAIFRHSNGKILGVTLNIDDDGKEKKISRLWSGIKSTITSSFESDLTEQEIKQLFGSLELPICNFNEFVGMTANKLKDWFIDFLPSTAKEIDWKTELTNVAPRNIDQVEIEKSIAKIESFGLSGVEQVRRANEYFKELKSYLKSETDRVNGAIQSLVGMDEDYTEDDIAEIDKKIAFTSQMLKKAIEYDAIAKANARIEEELASDRFKDLADSLDNDATYQQLLGELEEATNVFDELVAEHKEIRKKIEEANAEKIKLGALILDSTICPFLHRECADVAQAQTKIKSAFDDARATLDNLTEQSTDQQLKVYAAEDAKSTIESKLKMIQLAYVDRDGLKNRIAEYPEITEDGRDPEKWQADLDSLNNEKGNILASLRSQAMFADLTKMQAQLAINSEAAKEWEKLTGVNGLQTTCVSESPFIGLENIMNPIISDLLGEGTKVEFNLTTKANSFNFGINRGEGYIPFDLLSSGEKCLYTFALLISLIRSDKNAKLKLILIDDLLDHLDDTKISALFGTLKKIDDIQMIIAGVKTAGVDDSDKFTIEIGR